MKYDSIWQAIEILPRFARYHEGGDVTIDIGICYYTKVDPAVKELARKLEAVAVGNYHEAELGMSCPKCGQVITGKHSCGKVTLYCKGGCKCTKGHNKVKEVGPQAVPMRRVTRRYTLQHIYGSSYFGSGQGHGRVVTDDNCVTVGTRDNGFGRGPKAVLVKDITKPATFTAKGGDEIGENGRTWGETATWNPKTRQWE